MIELLVVVAVVALLASAAMPGLSQFFDRQRLLSQMRAISNVAQLARAEAIAHSAAGASDLKTVSITVQPAAPWFVGLANGGAACSGATCVINEGGNPVSHTVMATECAGCTMVSPASPQVIVFDLRGLVTGGTNQSITLQSPLGRQISLSINRLGRISLCTPSGSLAGYPAC